jgi:sulfate/thiosulfate-binding protein
LKAALWRAVPAVEQRRAFTKLTTPSAFSRTSTALFLAAGFVVLNPYAPRASAQTTILNVSYDPTRELYRDINALFAGDWKKKSGEDITIRMSHGGSGAQARAVIAGLDAAVVTLALAPDVDAIAANTGKIPKDWQKRLPDNSSPYTSTIVFLVRKGNPKHIKDWDDLVKPGIQVVTPNPKTSGGARWNYLAAWAYAEGNNDGDETKTRAFMVALFKNVSVLDTGARGATTTFARRGIGDVLIAWENEAHLVLQELGAENFEIVTPSLSILAEPTVSLVDGNVDAEHKREAAQAYLDFLYTPEAQGVIAKDFYRPSKPQYAAKADLANFPQLKLVTIDKNFGGWPAAQEKHFADGGEFDQIMATAHQ